MCFVQPLEIRQRFTVLDTALVHTRGACRQTNVGALIEQSGLFPLFKWPLVLAMKMAVSASSVLL